jgi:hypothetical protein
MTARRTTPHLKIRFKICQYIVIAHTFPFNILPGSSVYSKNSLFFLTSTGLLVSEDVV